MYGCWSVAPISEPPALPGDDAFYGQRINLPPVFSALTPPRIGLRLVARAAGYQRATVTRKKVAGMEVVSLPLLLFWLRNKTSSSFFRSPARPFFSAASNAFIVGP